MVNDGLHLHDELIGGYAKPAWMLNKSPSDNKWLIKRSPSDLVRSNKVSINFDSWIAPNIRFSSPECENDLITLKVMLLREFDSSMGSMSNGISGAMFARNYMMFARYKLSIDIYNNADLDIDFFEHLLDEIGQFGIVGILKIDERIDKYIESINNRSEKFSLYPRGKYREYARTSDIWNRLGFEEAKQLSNRNRLRILDFVNSKGLLHPQQAEKLKNEDREGNLRDFPTASRIGNFLNPIQILYKHRQHLQHDPIGFDPLPDNLTNLGESLVRDDVDRRGRTGSIPAYQACYLIDQALRWVTEYAPDLFRLVDLFLEEKAIDRPEAYRPDIAALCDALERFRPDFQEASVGSPFPVHPSYALSRELGTRQPPLRTAIFQLLPIACVIVVAAFGARRFEEINSLQYGCIKIIEDELWLETYIEKTLRDVALIPIPKAVETAIKVLETLSASARETKNDNWILHFNDISGNRTASSLDFYDCLEQFAVFVQVPPCEDGRQWVARPHEFRRFFGIVYYFRYAFGSLTALAHFYRHEAPDSTRTYITESSFGGFLREQQLSKMSEAKAARRRDRQELERLKDFERGGLQFRYDRYMAIAEGREIATGIGGDWLSRMLAKMIDETQSAIEFDTTVDPKEMLAGKVLSFAQSQVLEPNKLGHSFCKCTRNPSDLAAAGCLKGTSVAEIHWSFGAPDPTHASDEVCSRCVHNVRLSDNKWYWEDRLQADRSCASCAASPLLQALSDQRAVFAEAILSEFV